MTAPEETRGLVLAGGKSRRMGRDKALLLNDGRSQLEFAVSLLQASLPQVYVSTTAQQAGEPERQRFAQIVDRYEDMGPVAGILSAMETYPESGWLVLACDLPNVDQLTIDTLLRNSASGHPFTAFRSSHDGLPEPLCAWYAPQSRQLIQGFVDDGIVCPRKIMIRSDTQLLDQPRPDALDNVNTPDDLAGSNIRAAS